MTEPTKAEIEKLERCPHCESRRLKVTKYPGGTKHYCISCGYLQCWKEREYGSPIPTR